jgi:hypothetical protein
MEKTRKKSENNIRHLAKKNYKNISHYRHKIKMQIDRTYDVRGAHMKPHFLFHPPSIPPPNSPAAIRGQLRPFKNFPYGIIE